jgi:hypothetical protein
MFLIIGQPSLAVVLPGPYAAADVMMTCRVTSVYQISAGGYRLRRKAMRKGQAQGRDDSEGNG